MFIGTAARNLWQDTLSDRFSGPELLQDSVVEVVIIGGGFTGLSAALHLAMQSTSTCVLEAQTIGHGGSGRNVGYVNAGLWTPPDEVEALLGKDIGSRLNSMLADGPQTVFDLIERHQIRCSATRKATMHCATNASGKKDLISRYKQQLARGAPVKLLDAAETAKRTGSKEFVTALWDPRAGTIQPLAYAHGLAHAATSAGADVYENSPALSIEHDGANWRVTTPKGSVIATKLIQATNAYGTEHIHQNEFVPVHYFQMATEPVPPEIRARILPGGEGCWDCATVMSSFRFDPEGRMLIGAVGNLEEFGASTHRAWAKRKLATLFPDLADCSFEHAWHGCIAMTSDHLPKVVNTGPNAVSIFGYSGRGISPGTVFGKCAAKWAVTGDENAFPIQITNNAPETGKWPKAVFIEAGATLTHLISDRF